MVIIVANKILHGVCYCHLRSVVPVVPILLVWNQSSDFDKDSSEVSVLNIHEYC